MNQNDCDCVSDSMLLQQVVKGDTKSFEILYEKYWESLYSDAYKRLKDCDLAKDVVQEIFTFVWVKRETLCIENLPAYFKIAVRNKVFKALARQKVTHPYFNLLETIPSTFLQADANLLWQEFSNCYEELLKTLPSRKQAIFRLRFQQDLSTKEIAHQLGLSRKTVQNQLGKAIEQLRVSLFSTFLVFIWGCLIC